MRTSAAPGTFTDGEFFRRPLSRNVYLEISNHRFDGRFCQDFLAVAPSKSMLPGVEYQCQRF